MIESSTFSSDLEHQILAQPVYTTHEAAKCLNVFSTTVIHWIATGKLKCYKTPGGHRRIPAEDLIEFVKKFNLYNSVQIKQKPKILIVEDDEDAANLCVNVLGNERYQLKVVRNGFYAGIVSEFRPDIVVLDIMLPDIDGCQVCKFIKNDSRLKHAKIIAVSAISDPVRIKEMEKAGIDDYLAKPYNISEFEARIEKLLPKYYRKPEEANAA